MLQLLDVFLTQGWKITYSSPHAMSEHMCDIESLGIDCVPIELNNSSFDVFVSRLQPDIVLYDRFMMEEQFGWRVENHCPSALTILETVDLHCLRDARYRAMKQSREVVDADFFSDVAKREAASIHRCDLSLMISKVEIEVLKDIFRVSPDLLHYVPFMLSISDEQVKAWSSFSERKNFITIGNFKHAPNWDAVLHLKKNIWPVIRSLLPDAELHVYGAYASDKVYQLHNVNEGFIIKGRAEDANIVMSQARVSLAPLRFGAGIKGKLVESMLNGTPSVTTDIGAESMSGDYEWNGLIENEIGPFAEAAVRLYQDSELWLQSQKKGIPIINNIYNAKQHGEDLLNKIHYILNNIEKHRQGNFTGAMLKYHHLRSTEYMSRWIELKSRLEE